MQVRYVVLVSLLIGVQVFAVDEDYYIPYTDTYDYVYDPETGQYIKQEKPSGEGNISGRDHTSAGNNSPDSNAGSQSSNVPSGMGKQGSPNQDFLDSPVSAVISGVALAVIGFFFWLRRKKAVV